ncbi:hypothetical protein MMC22_008860, partial [Lobaria immixta]|nr:hypothetical protein [Lobaria immixta]
MSDSELTGGLFTDRVFVHALNTVKRIPRTGSARPPPSDRLKLYGLYKQSMEGDVQGVMTRPEGQGVDAAAEQEKWDAWSSQHGCSRTEAKRRYISTLIETMHKYASTTPESRELVAELEFVWDQIKSNSISSTSSSPEDQNVPSSSLLGLPPSQSGHQRRTQPSYASLGPGRAKEVTGGDLRVLRPVSGGDEASEDEDAGEAFEGGRRLSIESRPDDAIGGLSQSRDYDVRNRKWRKRIEQALVKMTTEIAALREQLEAKGVGRGGTRKFGARLWMWMVSIVVATLRHLIFDAMVVGLLLLWVGKEDERVNGAIGVLVRVLRDR